MKIAMILNQVQAGVGTKDNGYFPLSATQEAIGPGVNLRPLFSEYGNDLVLSIYVGEQTYFEDYVVIQRKIKGMLARFDIEGVICGPSFNYPGFSKMSLELAKAMSDTTEIKVLCAMSEENEALISEYKEVIDIVKMPKKGGAGLNRSYEAICKVFQAKEKDSDKEIYQDLIY